MMQLHRKFALALMACWLISSAALLAAPGALIVIGTTGDSSVTSDLSNTAQVIHDELVARGFSPGSIEILKGGATPETKSPETASKAASGNINT